MSIRERQHRKPAPQSPAQELQRQIREAPSLPCRSGTAEPTSAEPGTPRSAPSYNFRSIPILPPGSTLPEAPGTPIQRQMRVEIQPGKPQWSKAAALPIPGNVSVSNPHDSFERTADIMAARVTIETPVPAQLVGAGGAPRRYAPATRGGQSVTVQRELSEDYKTELENETFPKLDEKQIEQVVGAIYDAADVPALVFYLVQQLEDTKDTKTIVPFILESWANRPDISDKDVQSALEVIHSFIDKAVGKGESAPTQEEPPDPLAVLVLVNSGMEPAPKPTNEAKITEELVERLTFIASHTAATYNPACDKKLDEVFTITADVALKALREDKSSAVFFTSLMKVGFIDRLINIRLNTGKDKPLCHHSDVSVPLLECLKALPGVKIRMPSQTTGSPAVPIDETQLQKQVYAYMKTASKVMREYQNKYG